MFAVRVKPLIPLLGIAGMVLALGACGSTEEVNVGPTPTTAAVQQPAPAATAAPGAPAAPAATAMPSATAMPQPTAAPAGEPKYGGILRMANRADPPGWDPMFTGTISLSHPLGPFSGDGNLIKPCREDVFTLCMGLASSLEPTSDFSVWTFTIRDNVLWHDGTPFTAQDAKFWLDLALKGAGDARRKSNWIGSLGPITGVEVVGGNQLRVTLSASSPAWASSFMSPQHRVVHPRHLMQPEIDKGNATVSPDEVGYVTTGPYRLTDYRKGSVIRHRKFEQYWEKDDQGRQLPYLDGIDMAIIGDANTMVAAFRAGRIDVTIKGGGFYLTPEQQDAVTKDLGDEAVYGSFENFVLGMTPNPAVPPWDDVRVRKALYLWYDQKSSVEINVGKGSLGSLFPLTSPYANPDVLTWPGVNPETLEQDRVEAKRLLAEAGFPNGFKTTFMCRNTWVFWCEFADQQLKGLLGKDNVSIKVVDTATRDELQCAHDYEIYINGDLGLAFPETYASSFDSDDQCVDVPHGDPKIDDLFDQLFAAPNEDERIRIAREIERYEGLEMAYHVQMFRASSTFGWREYVKGIQVPGHGQQNNLDVATVWLDK
jgi:peptide/nickel transport system substrate-binding protein